jgi:AcrR family transcriptional regulator
VGEHGSQRVREAVLDAAAILMFEHGPNAITVEHSIVRLPHFS